jgi:hypothetical protein
MIKWIILLFFIGTLWRYKQWIIHKKYVNQRLKEYYDCFKKQKGDLKND